MNSTVTDAAGVVLAVVVALVTVLLRLAYRHARDLSALAQRVARLEGERGTHHQEDQ